MGIRLLGPDVTWEEAAGCVIEEGILPQDLRLQLSEGGAGLDPERVHEAFLARR